MKGIEEEPDEYIVERIVAHKKGEDGNYKYYVQWKGYALYSNDLNNSGSWEEEETVNHLEAFSVYWKHMKNV